MSDAARPLCRLEDLEDNGAREVALGGDPPRYGVVIARGGEVFAYLNVCPHAGRPMNWAPDRFLFSPEGHLVCAAHGAVFEVTSGACVLGPCLGACLTRVPIEVRDGAVWAARSPAA